MATTHLSPVQLQQFDQTVQQTAKKFADDVVRIGYSFGDDWYGDPAIFFRVILSEDASSDERLGDVTARIRSEFWDALNMAESEYYPFFRFRTEEEQERLKDPEWE